MKRAYLRADGNSEIGLGHLLRCIALAQMIKDDFDIHFVSKDAPESIIQSILQSGLDFTKIEKESTFLTGLKEEDIVLIDHYGINTEYQKKIKEKGCKLVCIDDLHDKVFFSDLIINHSPSARISDYHAQHYTQFALGLSYALLRPEFLKESQKPSSVRFGRTIFICFGGADYTNLTERVVKNIMKEKEFEKIVVVTGNSYQYSENLNQTVEKDIRVQYEHSVGGDRMLELIKISDWAIVPSSGILYEIIAVGIRPLICYFIDNQKEFHDYLVKECNFQSIGCLSGISEEWSISTFSLLNLEHGKKNDCFESFRLQISQAKDNYVRIFKSLI